MVMFSSIDRSSISINYRLKKISKMFFFSKKKFFFPKIFQNFFSKIFHKKIFFSTKFFQKFFFQKFQKSISIIDFWNFPKNLILSENNNNRRGIERWYFLSIIKSILTGRRPGYIRLHIRSGFFLHGFSLSMSKV